MNWKGTGVALITPMKKDGSIDVDALEQLVRHTAGVDYLVVMGTTGESATLDEVEKATVLNHVLRLNNNRLPVVFGIGGNNTHAVVDKLKKWDVPVGVSAILSVCPYYNKPSQEGIYRHFMAIADSSPTPVILYNVPGRTGQNMSASTTIRLAAHDNIVGIKEASGNLEQCLRIQNETPDSFALISGDDMLTTAIMAMGGHGVISVMANAFPNEFRQITDLASQGDLIQASAELGRFSELNPLLYEEGNPTGIKEVIRHFGWMDASVRLPLAEASESLRLRIAKALEGIKKGQTAV